MKVRITAPQKLLFEGEAKEVVLPGADGEVSVLDFHQACLYSLRQGQIKTTPRDKFAPKGRFYIKGGIAKIVWGGVDIIVEEYGQPGAR